MTVRNVSSTRRPTRHYRGLSLVWLVVFALMLLQIVRLQVVDRAGLADSGARQRTHRIILSAERGDLVDRYGIPLAMSVLEWRLFVDPAQLGDSPENVANQLAPILGLDVTYLAERLGRTGRYVVLAKGLDEGKSKAVRALKIAGIGLEEEQNRVNPADDLARAVLGRVNKSDGKGETGFEAKYDKELKGEPGEKLVERTARGQQIPAGSNRLSLPKRGTTFELTLDSSLQYAVDGMTKQAVATSLAKGGIVAVADIATGDVLALSNIETTADGTVIPAEHNAALVSVYEPGSVTKVITMAAALEERVVSPNSRINVPQHLQVSDHSFKDDEAHLEVTYTPGEILTHSSNIGTIKIAQLLGKKRVDSYFRQFGLGQKTGVDFPGESAGIMLPVKRWTGTSIGTVPIGQGLSVTALQMLGVYTTMANNGVRVPLRLVRGTVDSNGIEHLVPVPAGQRVVSSEVAAQVTEMLESVVKHGTGAAAAIQGYRTAGKTGTAQKPNENARGYKPNAYVASFAGFFPAERPRFAIIAILDEPQTSIYGGVVAAPLFAEVAQFTGQHYRVAPSSGTEVVLSNQPGAGSGTSADNSKEMRAVREAGSWQKAVIRKGALGAGEVVSADEPAPTQAASDQSTQPDSPASSNDPSLTGKGKTRSSAARKTEVAATSATATAKSTVKAKASATPNVVVKSKAKTTDASTAADPVQTETPVPTTVAATSSRKNVRREHISPVGTKTETKTARAEAIATVPPRTTAPQTVAANPAENPVKLARTTPATVPDLSKWKTKVAVAQPVVEPPAQDPESTGTPRQAVAAPTQTVVEP
jgi:cell division protein FtsI (penicillin-binding protein 3)